jgi:ABC-type amino acid transport substrate-binding protein
VSVAVPLLYNFPHSGKILTLAFLTFAAWFTGSSLNFEQLALLSSAGILSMFGNVNGAVPFLLDLLRLPADLFELFVVSSVINRGFGSMTAAMHTAALSLLLAAALTGKLHVDFRKVGRLLAATAVIVLAFLGGTRALFAWVLPPEPAGMQILSPFALRPPLAPTGSAAESQSAQPPVPGQRLDEIQRRGLLRVGVFPDAIPWAFINASGELVGFDVEAAHRLAIELGVALELVTVTRESAPDALSAGRIDIVMSGLAANVARARRMELSHAYSSERVGFLVPDHLRDRFATLRTLADGEELTIGVPPTREAHLLLEPFAPTIEVREYEAIELTIQDPSVPVLMMTLERASYWSRIHPEYSAVRPADLSTTALVVYALPAGELELRNLVDLWIDTRRASGELEEAYGYWVEGRALTTRTPRWSLLQAFRRAGPAVAP